MTDLEKPILDEAREIVVERSTNHENYGEFSESMSRARLIFIGMTGKELPLEDMYKMLVALKMSRESFHHKRDNLVDACGYLQGLEDYWNGIRREKTDDIPGKSQYIK
jgi:hypothetical protein|tara:strand:+ start:3319 stop:3642 length:324 start_codon:yes stop_codon:yes gene_type:complete